MLRIGDFARLSQVSVKALRFYDEIGLLKPTEVDPTSGYRYYAPSLLARLDKILLFKDLGFSLAEIASLLNRDLSDEDLRKALIQRRAELSRRISHEQAQLAQVDAWLTQFNHAGSPDEPLIALRPIPAQLVASVRGTLNAYDEIEELFGELQHSLKRHQQSGRRGAIWHACASRNEYIECEALILLQERVPEKGRMRVYEMPANTAVSLIHQGADDMIEESYRAARRWIKSQGYSTAGPNREIYLPNAENASVDFTEIQFPILFAPNKTAADV